jgi:site-specific recombinase XerD
MDRTAPARSELRWDRRAWPVASSRRSGSQRLLYNPASELLLPRLPRRLPKHILSVADIETLLNRPDVSTPSGLRDRAMLETLYSTGIRRTELVRLKLYELDTRAGSLSESVGRKSRIAVLLRTGRKMRPAQVARACYGKFSFPENGSPSLVQP